MSTLFHFITPALLGLTTLAAQSLEFGPLLSVAENSWPEKNRIGIVCDYNHSRSMVDDLAQASRPGTAITVVNAPSLTGVFSTVRSAVDLLNTKQTDYLVLLPRDRVYPEGSFNATVLVGRLAVKGIPSVGTRPVGLRQGAVFCIGPETNGQLLVTNKLVGTVDVILPTRAAKGGLAAPTTNSAGRSLPEGVTLEVLETSR